MMIFTLLSVLAVSSIVDSVPSVISDSPNAENLVFDMSAVSHVDVHLSSNPTPTLIAQEIPAIQEGGFVFEFLGCETTPNTDVPLTCNFMVENTWDSERELQLAGYNSSNYFSRVIDAGGNEIFASSARVGNSSGARYAEAVLPSRIPLRASLSFNQIPEGGIRILDIGLYNRSTRGFDVEFRFSR